MNDASHTSSSLVQKTLADIVLADARTAAVFDRLGMDYCCHGHQTLEDAATDAGLRSETIASEIAALGPPTRGGGREEEWTDLAALTRHITDHHHAYIRQIVPTVRAWLDKLVTRHGARHAELRDIRATFDDLAEELSTHMMKEEHILFPYVETLAAAQHSGHRLPAGPFGTVVNPIRVMEAEHREAADHLTRLRTLTDGYQPPADACTTYRACFEELARFQSDLHRHVHLENHVLFPRAIALERELS
jgi:regulator of cell morphogenesis and NO signaling